MKITLKEPIKKLALLEKIKSKLKIKKEPVFQKEKGENVIFMGTIGSGRSESMLQFYKELMKNKYIEERSIYINTCADNAAFHKLGVILDSNKDFKINVLTGLNQEGLQTLNSLNFKNKNIRNIFSKEHSIFILPYACKISQNIKNEIFSQLASYLINLPKNKNDKEIPIFFEDLSSFDLQNFEIFKRIVKILNKKGYFVVCSIEDYHHTLTEEQLMNNLEEIFEHAFVMKLEIQGHDYLIDYFKKFNFRESVMHLNPGNYYYLKNFKETNLNCFGLPYDLEISNKELTGTFLNLLADTSIDNGIFVKT